MLSESIQQPDLVPILISDPLLIKTGSMPQEFEGVESMRTYFYATQNDYLIQPNRFNRDRIFAAAKALGRLVADKRII